MPSSDPKRRLRDIIDNIDAINHSRANLVREQFLTDRDKYDAAERRLARISEAAVKLGEMIEDIAPNAEWKKIRGLGNWLRHEYENIIRETIWKTITDDLPSLRAACQEAITEIERRHARATKSE